MLADPRYEHKNGPLLSDPSAHIGVYRPFSGSTRVFIGKPSKIPAHAIVRLAPVLARTGGLAGRVFSQRPYWTMLNKNGREAAIAISFIVEASQRKGIFADVAYPMGAVCGPGRVLRSRIRIPPALPVQEPAFVHRLIDAERQPFSSSVSRRLLDKI